MTQEEIIVLARKSGMELYGLGRDRAKFVHYLTAFAKLIAAKEREACIKIVQVHCEDSDDLRTKATLVSVLDYIRARGKSLHDAHTAEVTRYDTR